MLKAKIESKFINFNNLDLSKELLKAGQMISTSIRSNVSLGYDYKGVRFTPNKQPYRSKKQSRLGHSRPLIAEEKKLVSVGSYYVKKISKSKVLIGLKGNYSSGIPVSDVGRYNQYGMNKGGSPRPFFGIGDKARKAVLVLMRNTIRKYIRTATKVRKKLN